MLDVLGVLCLVILMVLTGLMVVKFSAVEETVASVKDVYLDLLSRTIELEVQVKFLSDQVEQLQQESEVEYAVPGSDN